MKIACLGWGSLIWDPRDLPLASDWFEDGPQLPLEFSRQSADDRITLVIDDSAVASPTLWALLDVRSAAEAILAVSKRESAIPRDVARWTLLETDAYPYADQIGEWAVEHEIDAVVWTALPPGMKGSRKTSPTLDTLITHICSLNNLKRAKAAEYIFRAPTQIATRFRPSLEALLNE